MFDVKLKGLASFWVLYRMWRASGFTGDGVRQKITAGLKTAVFMTKVKSLLSFCTLNGPFFFSSVAL